MYVLKIKSLQVWKTFQSSMLIDVKDFHKLQETTCSETVTTPAECGRRGQNCKHHGQTEDIM